jgi:fructose-1,6-bisphosphatase/inositol monophosphatase family enzyme
MLALECTRKGNLEIAVAYGLIREAGGVMTTADGEDLGPKGYQTF